MNIRPEQLIVHMSINCSAGQRLWECLFDMVPDSVTLLSACLFHTCSLPNCNSKLRLRVLHLKKAETLTLLLTLSCGLVRIGPICETGGSALCFVRKARQDFGLQHFLQGSVALELRHVPLQRC